VAISLQSIRCNSWTFTDYSGLGSEFYANERFFWQNFTNTERSDTGFTPWRL